MELHDVLLAVAQKIIPDDRLAQQELIDQIEPVLFDRLMLTMRSQLTGPQNYDLDLLVQKQEADAQAIYNYFSKHIPTMQAIFEQTVQDFLDTYLQEMGVVAR